MKYVLLPVFFFCENFTDSVLTRAFVKDAFILDNNQSRPVIRCRRAPTFSSVYPFL